VNRRLLLVRMTKLLVLIGLLFAAYPFIATLLPDSTVDAGREQQWRRSVDLARLQPGELLHVEDWPGGPVAVYRRSAHELTGLERLRPQLQDPDSKRSQQPADLRGARRSYLADYFVFIPVETRRGCQVRVLPADRQPRTDVLWYGGFTDACGGSLYDTAGRLYRAHADTGQYNLRVPAYRPTGKDQIQLIGPPPQSLP